MWSLLQKKIIPFLTVRLHLTILRENVIFGVCTLPQLTQEIRDDCQYLFFTDVCVTRLFSQSTELTLHILFFILVLELYMTLLRKDMNVTDADVTDKMHYEIH